MEQLLPLHRPGGGEWFTTGWRGLTAARVGLPTCNGTTEKRRQCYGRWREILHSETADGGSLSRRVGGRLEAAAAATVWRGRAWKEVLYPPKQRRFDAEKKKIKINWTIRFGGNRPVHQSDRRFDPGSTYFWFNWLDRTKTVIGRRSDWPIQSGF